MFCHGELARLRPEPAHLTSFYFRSSLGSVLGALFVAVLAPQFLSGLYELHVALAVCALLVVVIHRSTTGQYPAHGAELLWPASRQR